MREVDNALAHARLAQQQLARSEHAAALESLRAALDLAPQLDALWAQFSELVRFFNLRHPVPPFVRELLARALEHRAVDPGDLVRPVSTLALSRPEGALAEPLLLRLLEDVVIRDASLERVITEARRRMLHDEKAFPLEAMLAIAHQCFNTEYVFDESADERARLIQHPASLQQYAAYASYRPLWTLKNPEHLESTPLASLARRQIREPLEERRLAAGIARLSGAQGAVSAAVQAQYETNPYPRWVRAQSGYDPGSLAQIVNELFPHADTAGTAQPPRILIAGCGTGQHAVASAQRFVDASVLAFDLSAASLAYAKRKTSELGLNNLEYAQADLLALRDWKERFDLIECSGVLHHLEDPFEGWRILSGLLKPGGYMRLGFYSEIGRQAVVRARELIAAEGFRPDPEGIRACRAAIRAREGDALFAKIARSEDFFSVSGCRDLLFHVQEHRFQLPQIAAMIERLGVRLLGFEFTDSGAALARYRARFPSDPRATSLANWHLLEQEFPDTFARMYQFWVRRAG